MDRVSPAGPPAHGGSRSLCGSLPTGALPSPPRRDQATRGLIPDLCTAGRARFLQWCFTLLAAAGALLPVRPAVAAAVVPVTWHAVAGLTGEAEILVDRWGVPHIYAASTYDAYFAQGFNAARDRLWQIDLWRKRGRGELARDLGPAYVDRDRAARLFLYRGDLRAEWIAYASDTKRIVEHFVAGINAYVELTRLRPELLPPEFALLGYLPAKWEAADVVRIRSHGLASNLSAEVLRARTVA
ncbi:MAG: penicillin acylase family protein, partial [Verrucomicrobia bacterium]|nr:penicillin acylase family protein [Verrucomicrobiota bacterium]